MEHAQNVDEFTTRVALGQTTEHEPIGRGTRITKVRAVSFGKDYKGRAYTSSVSGLTSHDQLTLETPEKYGTRGAAISAVVALADRYGFDLRGVSVHRF